MKSWLITIFIFPSLVHAQFHDNTWIFGYSNNADTTDRFGISVITFFDGNINIVQNTDVFFNFSSTNASFSDSLGRLQSFSNGLHIGNKEWDIMNNGEGISTEYPEAIGAIWPQYNITIPQPGNTVSHLYVYQKDDYLPVLGACAKQLSYAIVNMDSSQGLGTVVTRDSLILKDTLSLGNVTTTRHANGRDWWILMNEFNSNRYYRFLVTPTGVIEYPVQTIGAPVFEGVGQAVFSPNGMYYAQFSSISATEGNYIDIYNFDRCSGLLSNHHQYHVTDGYWGGLAFSPNSRFLYVNQQFKCWQYDMQAPDIWASRKIVAEYDGFLSPYPTTFFFMQLAPDGKIYSCTVTGSNVLHVIHNPDELGTNCNFQQHAVTMHTNNALSIPNHPNYRLGPLDGSTCDTLDLDNLPIAWWRSEQDTLDPFLVAFHDLSCYEPSSWAWNFGDPASGLNNTSMERHPNHIFSAAGEYQVCLTVSNSNANNTLCRTLKLGNTTAKNPEIQERIQVTPNPFRNHLSIALSANLRSPVFNLYDQMGRLILKDWLAFGITEIETSSLPTGMYFWEIRAMGETVKTGKCVKVQE